MAMQNQKTKKSIFSQNNSKRFNASFLLTAILFFLLTISPALADNVSASVSDLNTGMAPTYSAGDTLMLTGSVSLDATGWTTLNGLTKTYHLVLNDATTTIPDQAFENNEKIISVTGNEINSVGENAFYFCLNLTKIELPNATTFGHYAFTSCSNLTEVALPNATTFEDYVFNECSNLIEIELPNAITFGNYTFYSCPNLTKIVLPNATTFGIYSFAFCSNLTEIELPNATTFGNESFGSCSNLTEIELPNATTFGTGAFDSCSNLTEVALSNATTFGDDAFDSCSNLTEIELPNATTFGYNAFRFCSNLTEVALPNATTFGDYAFTSCSNLTEVALPNATTFGERAFDSCSNLYTIGLGSVKPSFGTDSFKNISNRLLVLTNESTYADLNEFPTDSFQRKGLLLFGKINVTVEETLTLRSSFTPETEDVLDWVFEGTPLSETGDTYSKTNIQKTDAGNYERRVTISDQEYKIASYKVTVLDKIPTDNNGSGGIGNAVVIDTNEDAETPTNVENNTQNQTNNVTDTENNSAVNSSNESTAFDNNKSGLNTSTVVIFVAGVLILAGIAVYFTLYRKK
ncbi:leucine-rich repeat domain-containing protein [Methanolapillus millepedarum]|uniref:Leucine-rich repeat domain-containing protein n=1 Tax=Methanolapillus millepedarum TaxID=3028296 RepID=A0AA96V512_9EURY|nr:hypothetical protein MsAc7_12370 [Methanosarcinaceae archaeon Ac7]